jgi:ribosome-binding protein aMBF1 (putative translation factor)
MVSAGPCKSQRGGTPIWRRPAHPRARGALFVLADVAHEFGNRIRARRTELGKSQEQLARDSRLHWSYLGQVERGQRNLTLHNILKLAEVLGVDPGDLVRRLRAP